MDVSRLPFFEHVWTSFDKGTLLVTQLAIHSGCDDYHLNGHFHQRIVTLSVSRHLLSPAAKRARRSFTVERSNVSACNQKSMFPHLLKQPAAGIHNT